jgi:hypothetical protein
LAGTTWGPDRYAYMPDERSSRPYVFLYFQMCASWASKFWLAPVVTRLLWAAVPDPHARLAVDLSQRRAVRDGYQI